MLKFIVKKQKTKNKPMVSIWKRGVFYFNSKAIKKWDLDYYTHVYFVYNKRKNIIKFIFNNCVGYKLTKRENSIGLEACGAGFLNFHNIRYGTLTTRYKLKKEWFYNVFYIKLKKNATKDCLATSSTISVIDIKLTKPINLLTIDDVFKISLGDLMFDLEKYNKKPNGDDNNA